MYMVYALVGMVTYVLTKELVFEDKELKVVKECLPDCKFIRAGESENGRFRYYQFMGKRGKEYDVMKLGKMISGFVGKSVKVFFNRVLTVRVYHEDIPKILKMEEKLGGSGSGLVVVGMGLDGLVYHDFSVFPHMIVAGTTGYGKSNFIRSLLTQIESEVVLIDMKNDGDYPQVTASTIGEVLEVLEWVVGGWKGGFVVIDEAAQLVKPHYLGRKEGREYLRVQELISEIARMGRSRGVRLVYCTQYPVAEVLHGQIKQNIESRVVFRLPTEVASRVALDESGAENLESGLRGRCLYKTDSVQEVQTFECGVGGVFNVKKRDSQAEGTRRVIEIG